MNREWILCKSIIIVVMKVLRQDTIGKVETSSYDIDLQEPSCDKINLFIQQCFENGIVRGGYGKIPESADTYFLLKKKFTATKENVKYYINFAIVTDEWTEFEALMQKENTETEIINNYLESIKPDTLFYFGYRIQTEKIKKNQFLWIWKYFQHKS